MAAAPAPQRLHSGEAKVSMGALQTLLTSPTCAALREYVRFFGQLLFMDACQQSQRTLFLTGMNDETRSLVCACVCVFPEKFPPQREILTDRENIFSQRGNVSASFLFFLTTLM